MSRNNIWRKTDRRRRLCVNKRIRFTDSDVKGPMIFDEIDRWCARELNCAYYWFDRDWDHNVCHAEYIIGFQDDAAIFAFIIKWLNGWEKVI